MLIHIPDVLTGDEIAACRRLLAAAPWQDGTVTAGDQAARVKHNLQIPADSEVARELSEIVLAALGRNSAYHSAVLPLRVLRPRFNRYGPGMTYGRHVDNAIQAIPGGAGAWIRGDVSSTLFLSDPDDYDGGELVIETSAGVQAVKLPAGHQIVYPASTLHRVEPITRGTRDAAFFWAQSLVKDAGERTMLHELDLAIIDIRGKLGDHDLAVLSLVNHYHNLLRRWSEL
ncbi:Fe2+-dependent dioxygenase [Burkholderia glumae]|uniref:Fe2+-dependent dioxygenase n=1 Tax=Burkholderia glumae TaxID=337 RepID=A0AAQ0BQM1_BURGL|nr:Fe2+-dependent dioxygenase [Burkholderia glumae]ACR30656.1 2OG-Fe(II) oxygenase [Burkholderia glumae BGR1]AJY64140.1 2OG-Fe(II) oxygenase superfamily protein [Burkholderia glumae LMG 2196 = ATCC 33617]KHJ62685.1 Fe(II)-dependent oxygenase [Burkholderia glumae]MCM2484051.1 Fe2+-dependent dioxygenase [Burkholderia glumae]MCM2509741.1 Fe2+-dependent dioxygenase [Burkholderia glumae]